ncbi:SHOCT domain-containing protein [Desulfosporosinus sp. Sb-LF]
MINYLLSLHILHLLKSKNLITDQEFKAIDKENKKSFLT